MVSNVSRVTHVSEDGKIWIGTDAGLNVFPNNTDADNQICERVKFSQIWGISQLGNHFYVASFDSGLYKFDLLSGALLHHWSYSEMPRIRRIRKINEQLYIVHAKGITRITPHFVNPLFDRSLLNVEPNDFPTDVFTINGEIHVAFYINRVPFKQTKDGLWVPHRLFEKNHYDTLNRSVIMCAKEINGHTYMGFFSNMYVDYQNMHYKVYEFTSDQRKQLAFWDIDGDQKQIYFAIGNNIDLNNGYFWKHDPNGPATIHLGILDERKYAWAVTVDPFHKGVWFSTLTDGAYFKPHYDKYIKVPGGYHDFKITDNYIVAWNSFTAYIKQKNHPNWSVMTITGSFKHIIEYRDTLYFLNNSEISYFDRKSKQIKTLTKGFYESFCVHQDQLYLFRLFGQADFYNLQTRRLIKNRNSEFKNIVKYAQNKNYLLLQIENQGFALAENNSIIPLSTDLASDITKNKFFFCGNYLITQIGNTIRISGLNRFSKKIKTLNQINLKDLFPDMLIEWINSDGTSLWMGNSSNAYQFKINDTRYELEFLGQHYLGSSPLSFEPVQTTQEFLYKKGKGEIMVIPTDQNNALDFQTQSDLSLKGASFNFKTIIPRTWVGQTFSFLIKSNNYFYNQYGRQPIEIWNHKGFIERKFIRVNEPYALENFPHGVYKIQVGPEKGRQHILFRIQEGLFYTVGFWFVLIITLGLLGYVIFQYQREKLSMNQKIASLQLSTLKANLNPHFVFNIMNLIQSLIVKSEKTKALKATSKLAVLNRMFLETSNKDLISLEEELDFAKKYMQLEKMRFEDDTIINFEILVEPNIQTREWYLPPLILQPLLENALKYGRFEDREEPSNILVKISAIENYQLHINITNPVAKTNGKSGGTNLGISLVKDRLALLNERYHSDYNAQFKTYLNLENLFVAAITIEKRNIAWMYS